MGTQDKLRASMNSTFANLRGGMGAQTDFGMQNRMANAGVYAPGSFGAQNAEANGTGVVGTPEQFQLGMLGVNPQGASGGNDLFSALQGPSLANLGLHPASGPIHAYAPTGLRERAIAAGGAPVTGFGGAQVSAAPNARGGMGFNLTQGVVPQAPMDPNPTPTAMNFLQTGVAPENPGAFPRMGGQPASTSVPASPFQQPNNAIFKQNQPGLANYIPKGNPEQIKAQLAVIQPLQKMQQEQVERNAIAAAHAPNVKDGLNAYLAAGGRDIGVIDSFKKNALAEQNFKLKQGAAETKAADAAKAEQQNIARVTETSDNVIGTIDKILPKVNWNTVGPIGSVKSHISGTDAYDLAQLRDTVKSNVGLTQLQQMRDASKTGASGFGQLSEKELDVLQSSIASLDQAQRPEQFRDALTKVRNHFAAWKTSFEAGQKASAGNLTPQEQARAILAIRRASASK